MQLASTESPGNTNRGVTPWILVADDDVSVRSDFQTTRPHTSGRPSPLIMRGPACIPAAQKPARPALRQRNRGSSE